MERMYSSRKGLSDSLVLYWQALKNKSMSLSFRLSINCKSSSFLYFAREKIAFAFPLKAHSLVAAYSSSDMSWLSNMEFAKLSFD